MELKNVLRGNPPATNNNENFVCVNENTHPFQCLCTESLLFRFLLLSFSRVLFCFVFIFIAFFIVLHPHPPSPLLLLVLFFSLPAFLRQILRFFDFGLFFSFHFVLSILKHVLIVYEKHTHQKIKARQKKKKRRKTPKLEQNN